MSPLRSFCSFVINFFSKPNFLLALPCADQRAAVDSAMSTCPTSSSYLQPAACTVGWYASRTLIAFLPSAALPLHLHAPHAQAMPRSSSTSNELPEAEREIATTSRACPEIMGSSTRSSAAWTHKGALFVSGARACARPSGHACTIHTSHAARGTSIRVRTRAHYCPLDRVFARG